MKDKNSKDVLKIFDDFQKMIDNKPSAKKMYEEVQMMKFKVHPVQGDISAFNLKNNQLIETLWSLGKLDELFQKEYRRLTPREKNIFFRIFDGLYQKFQQELNKVSLKHGITDSSSILEMEIFREKQLRRLLN